jgi:hypothetical protein
MAWLVRSPESAKRIAAVAQEPDEALASVITDLQLRIMKASAEATPTTETLRDVAGSLLEDAGQEKQAVGRLLATALESAGEKLARTG